MTMMNYTNFWLPALLSNLHKAACNRAIVFPTVFITMTVLCPYSLAEEYACQYRWTKKGVVSKKMPLQSIRLKIVKNRAIQQLGSLKDQYEVLENNKDELILLMRFSKKRTGYDYPVGTTVMTLDKKTGVFVISNTLAHKGLSNHGIGTGKMINPLSSP